MDLYRAQRLIGEDVITTLQERCQILERVKLSQPLGRRKLTALMGIPERRVRAHLDYLEKKELITTDQRGVSLNTGVEDITPFLVDFFVGLNTSLDKENRLARALGIRRALIAPTDPGKPEATLSGVGQLAANCFLEQLTKPSLIAVSGGSTMKAFCDNLRHVERKGDCVIPVRGAIGSSHSYQANTIAMLAGLRLSCSALTLPVPDNVDPQLLETLMSHPDITAVTSLYGDIDVIVFGVGRAVPMIAARRLEAADARGLLESGAVAEAVGHYLSGGGEILRKASGVGLTGAQLRRIPVKIAVAAGGEKTDAVIALCRFMSDVFLVTDGDLADAVLKNSGKE